MEATKQKYRKHGKDQNHPDFPHGEFAGYKAECRCVDCIQANRDYKREYNRNLRKTSTKYAENQREDKRRFRATEEGKSLYKSMNAKRRSIIKTDSDNTLIREIYLKCPEGYVVDHIIPLSKGGLHDPSNLQYLPEIVNLQKSNKLDYDYVDFAIDWRDLVEPSTTIG